MTRYKMADLDQWAAKVKRRQEAILRQAINDMLNGIEIVPGISRGGAPQRGKIPRDIGALANSLQSSLRGSSALSQTGEDSYVMIVGAMSTGDVARFVWGGNAAPHARAIHYGFGSYPGTFWVDVAAGKWSGYVNAATARAKALIQ